MKILYTLGKAISSGTIMQKGAFFNDNNIMYIKGENGEKISLFNIQSIESYCMSESISYCLKIKLKEKTLILLVPRIYLKIGTGFAIGNHTKTNELRKILQNSMT